MAKLPFTRLAAALIVAGLVLAGCALSAPAPTSPPTTGPLPSTQAPAVPTKAPAAATQAPAAPTKAPSAATQAPAAPTKAPAAQPTAVPAKKVDYPAKGRTLTFIVPWPAGGAGDVQARVMATALEKVLATPVQVVNKEGAGSQVGLTELARSKNDGYTIGWFTMPSGLTYLDPDRKAAYSRKDFEPIAVLGEDPEAVGVKADSAIKSAKDLVDAARATPGKISIGTTGLMADAHLAILLLQRKADIRFNIVHLGGTGPGVTQLLGGHIDAFTSGAAGFQAPFGAGQVRLVGVMASQESSFFPGVKTFASQGYDIRYATTKAMITPAGVPKEIVEILDASVKKALDDPEVKQKYDAVAAPRLYMDSAKFAAYWAAKETETKSLLEEAKKEQK